MKGIRSALRVPRRRNGNRGRLAVQEKQEGLKKSVDRALDVLEAFTYQEESLQLTDLARRLRVNKSGLFRILATLECRGYIEQDTQTGSYRLGPKTLTLAGQFLHHLGFCTWAESGLGEIVERCNETAYLAVLDGADVVYLLMHETTHAVRTTSRVGRRMPAYCTAAGKVLLAHAGPERLRHFLSVSPLSKRTEHTIVDVEALAAHFDTVAKQGYAVDNEEAERGVRCVAAPVRRHSNQVVAAVGLSGPGYRFPLGRIERELVPLVRQAGLSISRRIVLPTEKLRPVDLIPRYESPSDS